MRHLMDVTMCWGPHSGGIRRYVLAKRDWLNAMTVCRHTVVAPGATGPGGLAIKGLPLPCSGGYRLPLAVEKNARAMASLAPDLIEIGDVFTLAWSALRAGQRLGVPVVGFCHSNVAALGDRWGGSPLESIAKRLARQVYNECDLVLAPSQDMMGRLRSWGVRQVALQRLGVDTDLFHPHRRDENCWRRMGLPPVARVLLYAGRFAPEKRLDVLVDAARLLGRPHVLVCVGDGPSPPRGAAVVRRPFTQNQAELATLMASADVFVHAGQEETFGLAALEALACGCPVVAPRAGGLAELVDDQVGHVVGNSNVRGFVDAIEWTLSRDRVRLSQHARRRAVAHSWKQLMPSLMRRYQNLLS